MAEREPLAGRTIRVPASTSNLGPGFDAIGLALRLYLRVTVLEVSRAADTQLRCRFVGDPSPPQNAIVAAFEWLRAREGQACPGLLVEVSTEIPIAAGLGSSAAAVVAGLKLHGLATGRPHAAAELVQMATELEGHPDNATAAVLGGLTVSAVSEGGRVHSVCSPWPARIHLLVATPHLQLQTSRARQVLPRQVDRQRAVFNVQRAALLVQALHVGDFGAIREALRDRLHQPYRLDLVPGLREALALEHPALLGVFLSGAGPSIAALVTDEGEWVAGELRRIYDRLALRADVRLIDVHQPEATREDVPGPADPPALR